jgi:hypothetical protein
VLNKLITGFINLIIKSNIICIINHIVVKMAGEKVVPPKPEAHRKKE